MVHIQWPHQVDRDDLLPKSGIAIEKRACPIPTGVVDQHIDRPQRLLHLSDSGLDTLLVGDVDRKGPGQLRLRAKAHRQRLCRRTIKVENGDRSTFGTKARADGSPNAAGAAGHDNHLGLQSSHANLRRWHGAHRTCPLLRHFTMRSGV